MELEGSWLEKILLCWSVMDWPSTEKELEAWSPRPWKRPLESAETPGVVRVMRELRVEDWLSRGTLMKAPRSTSVWNVGSSSTRSPVASTVTVWLEPATGRIIFMEDPTTDRISTCCCLGANPGADAVT